MQPRGTNGRIEAGAAMMEGILQGTQYIAQQPLEALARATGDDSVAVLARHAESGKHVLVKVQATAGGGADRTRLEGDIAARLAGHPNVLSVVDRGKTSDGRPFVAIDLPPPGTRTLRAELEARGTLPWQEAADIALQVLSALQALHDVGAIHRALSPEAVWIYPHSPDSPKARAVLTDFGVAKVIEATRADITPVAQPTARVHELGRVDYRIPEQRRGEALDERSDIYQVGLLLWEMVAGALPGEPDLGTTALSAAALRKLAEGRGESAVPSWLQAVLVKATADNPDERHASAADLAAALRNDPVLPPTERLDPVPAAGSTAPLAKAPLAKAPLATAPPAERSPLFMVLAVGTLALLVLAAIWRWLL